MPMLNISAEASPTRSAAPAVVRRIVSIFGRVGYLLGNARRRRIAASALAGMGREGLRDIDLNPIEVRLFPQVAARRRADCTAWARHAQNSNGFGGGVAEIKRP